MKNTLNVMDAIITQHDHDAIFQKFGNEYDNTVVIIYDRGTSRTALYVKLEKVGETIKNITWEQLAELQQKAFEIWISLQN